MPESNKFGNELTDILYGRIQPMGTRTFLSGCLRGMTIPWEVLSVGLKKTIEGTWVIDVQ